MRIKPRNIIVATLLGGCLIGGGVAIGYSIKNANEIAQVQTQLNEETEESKIESLKQKVLEILNKQYTNLIVNGGIITVFAGSLLGVLVKNGKIKQATAENLASIATKVVNEALANFEKEKLEAIEKGQEVIKKGLDHVTTALVMMQDTTNKGKAALIEYLASQTKESETATEESKEIIEEVKESVNDKIETEEAVKEEIKEDYESIE